MRQNYAILILREALEKEKENEIKHIQNDSYKGVMLSREIISDIVNALESMGVSL